MTMDLIINKGIVKKNSEGEFYTFTLKDFNSGFEFPLRESSMSFHNLKEGDLVEFIGRVSENCIYLAISSVECRVYES